MPYLQKYDDFVRLYNEGVLVKFIQKNLGLTNSQYRKLHHKARDNGDITPRRKPQKNYSQKGKYYQKTPTGKFKIVKTVDGATKHFGTYDTEEQVKLAIEILESLNWNSDYSWSVKAQVLEEFNYNGEI